MINPSDTERNQPSYWNAKSSLFQADEAGFNRTIANVTEHMLAGSGPLEGNFTETFISIANATKGQTFESQAERFVSTRRTCWATWNVTNANITLIEVHGLQSMDDLETVDQDIIQNSELEITKFFFDFIGEYEWETREHWNQPLAVVGNVSRSDSFLPAVNTRSALVASMLWARITSMWGPERPNPPSTTCYWIGPDSITTKKEVMSLQRSPWLVLVIAINPIFTFLATLGKAILHRTPISDNFGVISLLAGFDPRDSKALQGAALSGKLTRDVKITFNARDCGLRDERIEIELDSHRKSTKLRRDKLYG